MFADHETTFDVLTDSDNAAVAAAVTQTFDARLPARHIVYLFRVPRDQPECEERIYRQLANDAFAPDSEHPLTPWEAAVLRTQISLVIKHLREDI